MPDVQPTNNPVPSDHPADARDNFKIIDEFVNSRGILTSPSRTGRQILTLTRYNELVQPNIDGAEAAAVSAAASAAAAEAAVSGLDYQGLWPDTGGSASKGDTYQTQVSGTGTGQYFTALQNTTVDPVGDDVSWREVVSVDSFSRYTDRAYSDVSELISSPSVNDEGLFKVTSWNSGWAAQVNKPRGGGNFVFRGNIPKSDHNGGTVISPTVPFNGRDDFINGIGESDPSGSGCFVRLFESMSVDFFGVLGDFNPSLPSTDDTVPIGKAWAEAQKIGVDCYLEDGKYSASDLFPWARSELKGRCYVASGSARTATIYAINNKPVISRKDGNSVSQIGIRNLSFDGNGQLTDLIDIDLITYSSFNFCRFENAGYSGFKVGGGFSNTFFKCFFNGNEIGFSWDNGTQEANAFNFYECYFLSNSVYGCRFFNKNGDSSTVGNINNWIACDFENNGTAGLFWGSGKKYNVSFSYFEYEETSIIIESNGGGIQQQAHSIKDNFIRGRDSQPAPASTGIRNDYCRGAKIVDNWIVDHKTGISLGSAAWDCTIDNFTENNDTDLIDSSTRHTNQPGLLSTVSGIPSMKTGATKDESIPLGASTREYTSLFSGGSASINVYLNDTNKGYATLSITGIDNGAGGGNAYFARFTVVKGSGLVWFISSESQGTTGTGDPYTITLSLLQADQCTVNINASVNHGGNSDADVVYLESASNNLNRVSS